jgi:hypothetical protein
MADHLRNLERELQERRLPDRVITALSEEPCTYVEPPDDAEFVARDDGNHRGQICGSGEARLELEMGRAGGSLAAMTRALIIFILLAGCGSDLPRAAEEANKESPVPAQAKAPVSPAAVEAEADESEDAAAVLRRYYRLINEGRYEAAARLRSTGEADAERLADNFKAYQSYHVQVGAPSRPARSGPWLYVSVPVMITGSFKGGKTFGSAGSVTMRRSVSDEVPATERGWRVNTG